MYLGCNHQKLFKIMIKNYTAADNERGKWGVSLYKEKEGEEKHASQKGVWTRNLLHHSSATEATFTLHGHDKFNFSKTILRCRWCRSHRCMPWMGMQPDGFCWKEGISILQIIKIKTMPLKKKTKNNKAGRNMLNLNRKFLKKQLTDI